MGTTSTFIKSRSKTNPVLGAWNMDYKSALALAKSNYKFLITMWSNGDKCGKCTTAETCMMQKTFTDFMKTSDAYFIFQYSGDSDKGQIVHDWIFKAGKLKWYPGIRITLWDNDGKKIISDTYIDGDTLRGNKTKDAGAKNIVANLKKILANKKVQPEPTPKPAPTPISDYKVRLNEKLTTAQVNKILDAIDKAGGYCPCQPKSEGSKCHCDDFKNNKGFNEPCICKIYVKMPK